MTPMQALLSLTPGGSEFVDDPDRCAMYAKDVRTSMMNSIKRMVIRERQLAADNAQLRELLREHEWCGSGQCTTCGGRIEDGHASACPLAAALKGGQT